MTATKKPMGIDWVRAVWVTGLLLPALLGGLLLRAEVIAKHGPKQYEDLIFDARYYYVSTGMALLDGRGFSAEYNERTPPRPYFVPPPLQAVFVAAVYCIAGHQPSYLAIAQALLNVLAGFVLLWILRRWRGWSAAIPMYWLWMLYPEFVYWVCTPLSESNYLVLLVVLIAACLQWTNMRTWPWALAIASVLGVLNLQRPIGILLGIWLAGFCLVALSGRQRWVQTAILLLVPFMILLPWKVRNKIVTGDDVWVSSNGGVLLHSANHIGFDPIKWPDYGRYPADQWRVPEIDQRFWSSEFEDRRTYSQMGRLYTARMKQYVIDHPVHFIRNNVIKFTQRFVLVPDILEKVTMRGPALPAWARLAGFHGLLLAGIGGGIMMALHWRRAGNMLLLWVFAYFTAVCTLTHHLGSGRLALPLRVFLAILAAVLAGEIWQWLRTDNSEAPDQRQDSKN